MRAGGCLVNSLLAYPLHHLLRIAQHPQYPVSPLLPLPQSGTYIFSLVEERVEEDGDAVPAFSAVNQKGWMAFRIPWRGPLMRLRNVTSLAVHGPTVPRTALLE